MGRPEYWEDPEIFRQWLGRSMPFRGLGTTVTDTAIQAWDMNGPRRVEESLILQALHTRTQGIVKGTLVVEKNLLTHLKQSTCAEEREWPVLCRYSSELGDPGLDVSIYVIQLHLRH
jgi:hypothetical protein